MKISSNFAKLLLKLYHGQEVNGGLFKGGNVKILKQFISDGILDYKSIGTQQKKIYCPDTNNLSDYLQHKYGITSLEQFIQFLDKETVERSDAVKATSDSKFRNFKIFGGFLINTFNSSLKGELIGSEVNLCSREGSFLFINEFRGFRIDSEITVVIVENFENFKFIERQQYLFNEIHPLFVWRYQNSNDIANWLEMIPNSFIYFGDYDPKGLHIYISEIRNKVSRKNGSFLIPDNLEELLMKYGKKELFERQMDQLKEFDFSSYPEIRHVIELLNKHKRCLEQEALIQ